MGLTRASLTRGPAYVTWNGFNMFTEDDIVVKMAAEWRDVNTSMFGRIDRARKDVVLKIPVKLWGAWENVSALFPAIYQTCNVGASVFGNAGAADLPLIIQAKNNDKVTFYNAMITKMADLRLGVDSNIFEASVEFTAIIADGANPEDAAAYYLLGSAAYSDATAAFAKTNFKAVRWSGVWGALAGFGAIATQDGFHVSWNVNLQPQMADGIGTVDYTVGDVFGVVKCIPIGPTLAQIDTNLALRTKAHGTLLSANVASSDLVLNDDPGSVVITMKEARITESDWVFSKEKLRNGELTWETTRGFTAGAPTAVSTIA